MNQGIKGLVITGIVGLMLTGCVTENTYQGTDIPVAERNVDKVAAARERMQLGLTYLRRGNAEQAKFNLDKAAEYAPQLSEVHIALAYYYQTVGDLVRTEDAYRDAISASDASGDARNNFGVFLCQQEKYPQAEKMFLAAIETPKYTRTASSYENLGVCSRKSGELDKARKYFNMALKYDPRRANTLMGLAELTRDQGDLVGARQIMARYHQVVGESPESLAFAIKIEQEIGDTTAMKDLGIRLIAKFPSSSQAKEYRANLH